jgi:hypothetical protein
MEAGALEYTWFLTTKEDVKTSIQWLIIIHHNILVQLPIG